MLTTFLSGAGGRGPRPAAVLPLLVTLGVLAIATLPARAQTPAPDNAAATQSLSVERAEALLEAVRLQVSELPASAKDGTPEARLRNALQRQIGLIEEYLRTTGSSQALRQQQTSVANRIATVEAEKLALAAASTEPVMPPGEISKEALGALESELSAARAALTALRDDAAAAENRLQTGIEADTVAARERAAEAARQIELLSGELSGASADDARRQLQVELTNARFEEQVAEATLDALEVESTYLRAAEPLRAVTLDTQEQEVSTLEARFSALAEALQAQLAQGQLQTEAKLEQKEQAVEEASTPADRFLAEWEAELARSGHSEGEVQALIVPLTKDVAEQEKRIASEKDEQSTLRSLIARSGTSGAAGERISRTLQQLKRRRAVITRTLQGGQIARLGQLRDRRFKVEDLLISLAEPFDDMRDELAQSVPEDQRAGLVERADALGAQLRKALRAERVTLGEAIALSTELQNLLTQRLEILDNLARFIRARAFWLRDGKPVGPSAFAPLSREVPRLQSWLSELVSAQTRERLADSLGATTVIYALLLFPVLPILLFWARQRVRAVTRRINDRVQAEGRRPALLILTMFTGLLSAALLPAYFLLAARLVASAGLPANVGPVLSTAINHLGMFLLLWFLSRSFFHRRGIAEVQFGMSREAANDLYAALRWLLLGYLLWLTPWQILLAPPFNFEAIPRALYLAFLATTLIGVRALVRPDSAFVQHRLEPFRESWVARHWKTFATVTVMLAAAAIVLDLIGYRYASRSIGLSILLSLAILVALTALRQACMALVTNLERRRGAVSLEQELTGEADDQSEHQARSRLQQFINVLFVILLVLLIAAAWGLDQQALQTLDEVNLYTVRGAGGAQEFVTAADLLRGVFIVVFMFWLLRTIPGVYEYALFPRLSVDAGVKYAMLSITRYGVFVVGIFLALAEIHLDLGRLGWLMAAIGVGLGFGLQEIVSNFVSGLILLIERPVRPGDVVSVGGMTGTVQRINIRATTIINFDKQEVMVPNRSLITSEVTNWTRGDTMNRVVIQLGIAYGSDVDRVCEILARIADEQPRVLKTPPPTVLFMNHGESSLDLEIRVFVPSPSDIATVRDAINRQINRELKELGIEIPFPQRDLHIRSGMDLLAPPRAADASAESA